MNKETKNKKETRLTPETIRARLQAKYPHGVDLVYINYDDRIEDTGTIEEVITTGYAESFFEAHFEWVAEAQWQSIECVTDETFTTEECEEIADNDALRDAINDWCYEHDRGTPLEDLAKNTGDVWLFYDLGMGISEADCGPEAYKSTARAIAKRLHLSWAKHRGDLIELVNNSYGGRLVVLWNDKLSRFLGEITDKHITFNDPFLCIMDRDQGSGYDVQIEGRLVVEFDRRLLHSDDGAAGYSYAREVCGLIPGPYQINQGWTDKPGRWPVRLSPDTEEIVLAQSGYKKQEARYDAEYKAGGCTFGDDNFRRHQETEYRNEYPCGTHCKRCGQFWID